MIQLTKFKISAFRSCKNLNFELAGPITCFIGPNGAGKTNVLHALLLLKREPSRLYQKSTESPDFRCELGASFGDAQIPTQHLDHKTKIAFAASRRNAEEVLDKKDSWKLKGFEWSEKTFDSYEFDFVSGRSRRYISSRSIAGTEIIRFVENGKLINVLKRGGVSSVHSANSPLSNIPKNVVTAARGVKELIDGMQYCSASQFTNPSLSPTSFEIDEDGDLTDNYAASRLDHTKLIFSLYKFKKQNELGYEKFLSMVGESGLKIIKKIDWQEKEFSTTAFEVRSASTVINKVVKRKIVIPIVSIGDSKLSFNQLSEGTFRTIALLFYILSDENKLLLIEEPEVGIHHGLLESVVQVMKDVSTRKQIIFSTHSEVVVDQINPENICLVANDQKKGTLVKKLTKSMSKNDFKALKSYLKESGNLGEYWRSGGFEEWR
jgi:predicted ATP-dependent endonuclease of OLD family